MAWTLKGRQIELYQDELARLREELREARDVGRHPLVLTLTDEIAYLRAQLDSERGLRLAERDEYKRAVDRLIEAAGAPAIGQGAAPRAPEPFDVTKLLGIFEYEHGPDGRLRRLTPEEGVD